MISLLAVAVLAGCSNPETRSQANRGFDYEQETLRTAPLLIPEGLQAPRFNTEYVIPKGTAQGVTGKVLDIRPPTQVLPLVRGSEAMTEGSGLWFYQQRLDQPLERELNQALTVFFEQTDTDYDAVANGFESSGDAIGAPSQQFRWQLMPDAVRRAVAVQVQSTEGGGVLAQDRLRAEASMLNAFSLSYQRELSRQQELLDQGPIALTLDAGQGLLLAEQDYDRTWKRLITLLPRLGFDISNRQQALGYVDVEFDGLSKGDWQDLRLPALDIPEQEYRIQLGDLGSRTSLSLSNKDREPVAADVLSKLVNTLAPAFERTDLVR
ncbi:lipoprotein-34 NlpB [Oceanimonas sp. GK1]|uniref:Outer membrane protein assembly factor BamC n=1 Tax=Oceanimonas sp. (strain GK1 / IBRC-M 10197) TaxID=511062 RepID=BAMC_OCESG|nr:outer membrane protein assembly factor BamC [Oceanimonas sp. GK1]H2FU77.1 RecName: Full=Outer membrane protein assembly factor BamC; Flags: Precursor [Oceanimonas sp. GK1]AEY01444.1 lipoprotein-34 NlpB [Oceanimonas sp. GK1]